MSVGGFLKYNNAFPIAVSIMLLGAGGAFAASNPSAIYSAEKKVLSVDNTYIASKDLSAYTPKIQIIGVTEDADFYYVAYTFFTVDLKDYVWQDVAKSGDMKVSKADLGPYRDLGLYVTSQLKQIVDRETQRLAETQGMERRNVTQKTVAIAYGGLVGKFLDNKTEALPGYTPVVTPPPPPPPPPPPAPSTEVAAVVVADPAALPTVISEPSPAPAPVVTTTTSTTPTPSGEPPTMQVLGDNPATVAVGSEYVDLGATITGPTQQDLGLDIGVFINGQAVTMVRIDTSKAGEWTVRYTASNASGSTSVERQISVYDPPPAPPSTATSTSASTTDPAAPTSPDPLVASSTEPAPVTTPPADPAPAPTSEPTPDPTPDPTPADTSTATTP